MTKSRPNSRQLITSELLVASSLTLTGGMVGAAAAYGETRTATKASLDRGTGHTALFGYDVSYRQRKGPLPKDPAFAIVGIDYPYPDTPNKAFHKEYNWAETAIGGTLVPRVSAYVLTANPGDVLKQYHVTDWPKSGKSKYGVCNGSDSVACGALYGIQRAKQDIEWAKPDKLKNVWLDIEPKIYSWTSSSAKNAATLEGMVSEFESQGIKVGLYFQPSEFTPTFGEINAKSDLHGLPEWYLGATTLQYAKDVSCKTPSVTTGPVEIAQIAGNIIDKDIACKQS